VCPKCQGCYPSLLSSGGGGGGGSRGVLGVPRGGSWGSHEGYWGIQGVSRGFRGSREGFRGPGQGQGAPLPLPLPSGLWVSRRFSRHPPGGGTWLITTWLLPGERREPQSGDPRPVGFLPKSPGYLTQLGLSRDSVLRADLVQLGRAAPVLHEAPDLLTAWELIPSC
jgi:hypothetical protein